MRETYIHLFTLKNPHNIPPTKYQRNPLYKYKIKDNQECGPAFPSNEKGFDALHISDHCNTNPSYLCINKNCGFEYDETLKSSLFLNSNEETDLKHFTIEDYEVFCVDYLCYDYIYDKCTYLSAIWDYVTTKDISVETLKGIPNETDLLKDLDTIDCKDSPLLLKISKFYFKNPSQFLLDTQIVDQQYDSYLKEWTGIDTHMKMVFRSSDNNYSNIAYMEFIKKQKTPLLLVVKSTCGWIFGGYSPYEPCYCILLK